jgi:hypothetical protein
MSDYLLSEAVRENHMNDPFVLSPDALRRPGARRFMRALRSDTYWAQALLTTRKHARYKCHGEDTQKVVRTLWMYGGYTEIYEGKGTI